MERNMGVIISESRQNLKMTQEELAGRLGVTAQAVSRWERGVGLPDVGILTGLCQVLQLSGDRLLGLQTQNNLVENQDGKMERAIKQSLIAEPLVLEFGKAWLQVMSVGLQTNIVNEKRRELAEYTGMLLPLIHMKDNLSLGEKEIRLLSYDKVLLQCKSWEEMCGDLRKLTMSEETSEMESFIIIIERVVQVCREHYDTILNKQLVKIMVDNLKEQYPGVADGIIPEKISYLQVLNCLREKIRQKESIRDFIHIVEDLEVSL